MISKNLQHNNNTVFVYLAEFDKNVQVHTVAPAIRDEQIQRCTDTLAKQQRYCVWKLLDYALHDCYGKSVNDFNFTVSDTGKWLCNNGVHFSLSHSHNVVAVAIGNQAVGVDVEAIDKFAHHAVDDNFSKRTMTDNEQLLLRNIPSEQRAQALAEIWTQKECFFKLQDGNVFIPKAIDTTKNTFYSQFVMFNGKKYALSLAAQNKITVQTKITDAKVVFSLD